PAPVAREAAGFASRSHGRGVRRGALGARSMSSVLAATVRGAARRVERYETIVVGGGQAGLAAGYHLAKRDADFLILDANDRVGDSWRNRWDSLRLFTPAKYSALPGMRFPAPSMHLPDKDKVADYLERYAERFDLPVRVSTQVTRLSREGSRYVLTTD